MEPKKGREERARALAQNMPKGGIPAKITKPMKVLRLED